MRNGYLARVSIAVPPCMEDLVPPETMLAMTSRILWALNDVPADGELNAYYHMTENVLLEYGELWHSQGRFIHAQIAIRMNPPDVVSIRVNLTEIQ